jgi:hypothetical protein
MQSWFVQSFPLRFSCWQASLTLNLRGKPGPGVLLLHMCNTTRKSWEPVAKGLSAKGINALTVDNRGFGESGGPRFDGGTLEVRKELNDKWPADFDAAYDFFVVQPGVDKARMCCLQARPTLRA